MEENNDFHDEEFDKFLENEVDAGLDTSIDELQKRKIDVQRIKKIDNSKKRATIDSVFDERTIFALNKLLVNGPLERIEGIISAGKEANVYLAYDLNGKEVAIKIYKIDSNTSENKILSKINNYIGTLKQLQEKINQDKSQISDLFKLIQNREVFYATEPMYKNRSRTKSLIEIMKKEKGLD